MEVVLEEGETGLRSEGASMEASLQMLLELSCARGDLCRVLTCSEWSRKSSAELALLILGQSESSMVWLLCDVGVLLSEASSV